MGRLYRRHKDGNWYGDYTTPEGRRVQRSLTTKDRVVAKERLRLAELGATTASRGKKQRLMDAIDAMVRSLHGKAEGTKAMYREKGRRLLKTLGNPFVSDISMSMLDKYIERRRGDEPGHGKASDHTIQKELITVRRALKHSIKSGMLHAMPAWPEFSPNYKPKDTWLTVSQFERLCAELEPKRQLWAMLSALTSANSSEVEGIAWETIDITRNRLLVPGTKRSSRYRWVPIAPALKHRLEQVKQENRRGRVVTHWGNVRRDLHAAVKRANARSDAWCAKAGVEPLPRIPRVSPNDLRRTFASWLVQDGVPLLTVAALMGHKSTRMLELVYGKLSAENLEDAIARLPVTHGVTTSVSLPPTPDHTGDDRGDAE